VASWADEMEKAKDGPESPWAVAISQFKKLYEKNGAGTGWVKKVKEAGMAEAVKTVGGKEYPAGDFLVTEDSDKPTTWHLQVKRNGKPDHGLMGGAWASLHKGYRGNKYEGPGKTEAISKLKALYKSEDMEAPTEESYKEMEYIPEVPASDAEFETYMEVPITAISFADVDAAMESKATVDRIKIRLVQFKALLDNVMWQEEVEDKAQAIRNLTEEFIAILPEASEGVEEQETLTEANFAESEMGSVVALVEADEGAQKERKPLQLDVVVIQPGWGNAKDNNYYSAEMLRQYAGVFEGAKMYATDHRADEKSVRTEVSQILKCPVGFTETGAPIARAGVINDAFEAYVRNRDKLGILADLHCSIKGKGQSREGFELDGRKGWYVESITPTPDVDWVTKAGAGGHAHALVESESGGGTMPEEETTQEQQGTEEVNAAGDGEQAPVMETQFSETQEEFLSETEIGGALGRTNLPQVSQDRLAAGRYGTDAELQEAITAEIKYVKALTGSGEVRGMGSRSAPNERPGLTNEEYEEGWQDILRKNAPAAARIQEDK